MTAEDTRFLRREGFDLDRIDPAEETPISVLPNSGRWVRLLGGKFHVQPVGDKYWVACETLDEALRLGGCPEEYL
jgi:hypothetical protein